MRRHRTRAAATAGCAIDGVESAAAVDMADGLPALTGTVMGPCLQRMPQRRQLFSIAVRVAVIKKHVIALMRSWDDPSVFDRAPVLLGAGGHLPHVPDHAIGVAAKCAVDLFDPFR